MKPETQFLFYFPHAILGNFLVREVIVLYYFVVPSNFTPELPRLSGCYVRFSPRHESYFKRQTGSRAVEAEIILRDRLKLV